MRRFTALAVSAALVLSACGGGDDGSADADPDNPITIDVTVTESFLLPWLVAKEKGFFEANGVIVDEINLGTGGSTTLRSSLSGGSPIGDVSFAAAVEAIEQGAELEIVSGALNTAFGVDFYALAGNDKVNTLEDVEKWGITNPGSVSEAVSYVMADELGLTTEAERVATGGVGEGLALLEAGEIDVMFVPPWVEVGLPGKLKPVAIADDILGPFQSSVITVTKDWAESHPKAVEAIIKGFVEATEWMAANPQEAADLYAPEANLTEEQAMAFVEAANSLQVWGTGFSTEALDLGVKAMTFAGHEGEVDYCSILNGEYLPNGASQGPLADC